MKKLSLLLFSVFAISLVFVSSCQQDDDDVLIEGGVTEQQSGDPIENATVQITSPQQYSDVFSRTDAQGLYSLSGIDVSEVTDLVITASASDYVETSRNLKVTPNDVVSNFDFELAIEGSDDPGSGDDDDDTVTGESAGAARLQLLNVSEEFINVRGTGGVENATFTFVVLDSAGRAINLDNAVEVQFNMIKNPGGGEVILPDRVETNAQGRVVGNLSSGDSSGVVRLEALIERQDVGLTIRSNPILIAIQSGFPAPDRFYIAPTNYNVEGYGIVPGEGSSDYNYIVTASVGDKHGNPVKSGTAVDFRTELGGIIEGSSLTDENGRASVILRPDGSTPTSSPLGVGFIKVLAKTVDENNDYVRQELDMLFSTKHANISISPQSVDIPANGSQTFSYTVTDLNGNPMAAGTQISVEVANGLEATGDVGFNLGDFINTGPGSTEFGFTVSDTDDENSNEVGTSITIRVSSAISGSETTLTIQGTRAKISRD
ncbi:MAG: carboxypeptidase regulatory-like domain-containing protein [Gracilimonas sp.]